MSTIQKRALRLLAAGTVAAGVMLPAVALAQEGGDEYPTPSSTPECGGVAGADDALVGAQACQVPSTAAPATAGGSTAVETSGGGGSLPVTGGQIAGLTLIGLGITGAGVVMVRLGRRPVRVEA